MAAFRTLDDLSDLAGRRALVRVDLNVPFKDGVVGDTTRIERILPTIRELVEKGARVILLAHFGRPKGKPDPSLSLQPIVPAVAKITGLTVGFSPAAIGDEAREAVFRLSDGDVLVLENTRFYQGEEANDPEFAAQLAALGDIYINDAFSAAHRAHASTEALAHILPAYAGRAMQAELDALEAALGSPKHPVVAVVGGAKVSTKIDLLANLIRKVDALIIGGGMANTFLAARGIDVGQSLCEPDLAETARRIMTEAAASHTAIILPNDVVVAVEFAAGAEHTTVPAGQVPSHAMILDVGEQTISVINSWIDDAATLIWNGPLGAFEVPPFDKGTVAAARHAAERTAAGKLTSIAGGGDTVAALNRAGAGDDFSYVSTAGGAFLEWMEGKTLPGVKALAI